MYKATLPFVFLATCSLAAQAGPAEDARAHFEAIAAGQVEAIMGQYAANATLQWVGGPLDGGYGGAGEIRDLWNRFVKNAPYMVTIAHLEESANDKGATVTANVQFQGKSTVKVRYVLVYRNGKLVNEIWQVDPKLSVAAY